MSKFNSRHVFTSESISEGHPDKVCDQISDAILDACLAQDENSHVACETAVGPDIVVNLGEFRSTGYDKIDTEAIAREVVKSIGYDRPEERFSWSTFKYINTMHGQSSDINMGVNRGSEETQGAGDQGMVFGYASNATEQLMPAPIMYAHYLIDKMKTARREKIIPYLRPDAKSQVSILHENGKPVRITDIVISNQTEKVPIEKVRSDIEEFAREQLANTDLVDDKTRFFINPTGAFITGGPCGDAGLTGRKIIVDTYGGVGAHGGGAFSGKDPSKVDRSAAYYARYCAKNLVAAGIASKCEIQIAYAIGIAEPVSINVDFFGTGKYTEEQVTRFLKQGDTFDFRPGKIISALGLKRPVGWSYRNTANGGHFGREIFPWERTDKVDMIKDAL
jgi:S-adenosylmethionine synthetase